MDIGKLQTRGMLQSPPAAKDALGQPTGAWTDVATIWVNVMGLTGLETIRGGAETGVSKVSLRTRSRAGMTSAMRFVAGGVTYNFKNVPPYIKSQKFMDITAEVVT